MLIAALWLVAKPRIPALMPVARVPTGGAPASWPDAVARIGVIIAADRPRAAAAAPDDWLTREMLANRLLARARLTGSFDDYQEAQALLDQGFAHAPVGQGPHMTQAVLAYSTHRLPLMTRMLDATDRYVVPVEAEDRDEVTAMRGDVAFYHGRYATALAAYRAAGSRFRTAAALMRLGQPDAAVALFDEEERSARWPTAQLLSNLALQRGVIAMQRGDRAGAAEQFTRADRLFPGSWLIEAHRAQMTALGGRRDLAIAQLERIAARTPDPLVMDLLASLYRAGGDAARSRAWADRASAGWSRRLAQFPEAAWGHAVEHELAFGSPARALDLAKRDFLARPYGGTAVALGWALLANARPADALRVITPVLRSSWVSAEQHLVAAQALLLLGRGEEAERERAAALAVNPHAADDDASLIWFGH